MMLILQGKESLPAHWLNVFRLRMRWTVRKSIALSLVISISCTLIWLFVVLYFGFWERVASLWPATVTMIAGSLVAGSTPQGGGVVAFPVFTKIFGTPAEVARTFSLCIQSVGMTVGSAWILLSGKPVEWRAIGVVTFSAAFGLLITLLLATSSDLPFRPAKLSPPYVKVTFTIILIAMAFVVYEVARIQQREFKPKLGKMKLRVFGTLGVCGLLGGASTALVGSGADLFLFIGLVLFLAVDPKVGVLSSVICMALVSLIGVCILIVLDQSSLLTVQGSAELARLTFELNQTQIFPDYDSVSNALFEEKFDVFGFWLASVPVVVWGAPIGTWFAAKLSSRNLVAFVIALAFLEGISTVVFVKSLRQDPVLVLYFVFGCLFAIWIMRLLANRQNMLDNEIE